MADYGAVGMDGEGAEIRKLNADVLEDTDNFENWEKLVRAVEGLEGGLNRNSSPQSIVLVRDAYDRFLAKFPLLFGYWKKYADLEFSIAGTEAAELVYERGIASITNSVDLWTNYCTFKVETSHDPDVIRELFERGASCVGLDFLAHPFWDKYLEFEERLETAGRIFPVLDRVIHIPMHQYARYFERFRHTAQNRALAELVAPEALTLYRGEVEREVAPELGEAGIQQALRSRIDSLHLEIFARTQGETTKRWTFESEIKRPYFHVTELEESQLANWRKYLDFEEAQGNHARTTFLYERCLVTCALYDEFWLRYARWMSAQPQKEEEVRHIYQRASALFAPISRPTVRLQYALFEESCGNVELAKDIHNAILINLEGHMETITSLANLTRRHGGFDAAAPVYQTIIESPQADMTTKATSLTELAQMLYKVKGSVNEARQLYQKNEQHYLASPIFWHEYLQFEVQQCTGAESEENQYARIKQVHEDIRKRGQLPPASTKDLSQIYLRYLLERGSKDAAKEYMQLDREINGPISVQRMMPSKAVSDANPPAQTPVILANGH